MTKATDANAAARKTRGRGIQSIEVGHRLLAALVATGKAMTLRDLAAASDLAPAQAHAYLASFRRIELVEQDAASGEYSLGPLAMRLGLARMRSYDRLSETSAAAVRLSQDLGLMVCVVVWGPQAPTVIEVQEGAHTLNLNIREGTLFSVTGTASGRLFGALSDDVLVAKRIEAELSGTVVNQGVGSSVSRQELKREFSAIREKGFATALGSPVPGINAVSAPIFDHGGALLATLTLIGDEQSMPAKEVDFAVRLLLAQAQAISRAPASKTSLAAPRAARYPAAL
jgi:DNA-binding IclR family transcriptional regulator